MSQIVFRRCPASDAPARDLVDAMMAELIELYGDVDGVGSPLPSDFGPPNGVYLVGWDENVAVAGGGLRRLHDVTAEIRRMYVVPSWRRTGAGRQLLEALESEAGRLGFTRVRLSTGPRQQAAIQLYRSRGYVSIADYNGYAHTSFWGEKAILPVSSDSG